LILMFLSGSACWAIEIFPCGREVFAGKQKAISVTNLDHRCYINDVLFTEPEKLKRSAKEPYFCTGNNP
jgi:hypothetical protein